MAAALAPGGCCWARDALLTCAGSVQEQRLRAPGITRQPSSHCNVLPPERVLAKVVCPPTPAGGVEFIPVNQHCCMAQVARAYGAPAICVALGSSYFQRLLMRNADMNDEVAARGCYVHCGNRYVSGSAGAAAQLRVHVCRGTPRRVWTWLHCVKWCSRPSQRMASTLAWPGCCSMCGAEGLCCKLALSHVPCTIHPWMQELCVMPCNQTIIAVYCTCLYLAIKVRRSPLRVRIHHAACTVLRRVGHMAQERGMPAHPNFPAMPWSPPEATCMRDDTLGRWQTGASGAACCPTCSATSWAARCSRSRWVLPAEGPHAQPPPLPCTWCSPA